MDAQQLLGSLESFLNSNALDLTIKAVLFYFAALWIALIVWVTKDITNRTNNVFFQITAILLIIFGTPVFGLILYLIIRPGKTMLDRYYEELETELLEEEEEKKLAHSCVHCQGIISEAYTFCPHCAVKLKEPCGQCHQAFDTRWHVCPFCGTKKPEHEKKHEKPRAHHKTKPHTKEKEHTPPKEEASLPLPKEEDSLPPTSTEEDTHKAVPREDEEKA